MKATSLLLLVPVLAVAEGSPGPLAGTCGTPALVATAMPAAAEQARRKTGVAVYPAGEYPVRLPAISLLGARNDLPNPYRSGESWGKLPAGRVWGSVASVSIAPDGTIWVADRCGEHGSGGAACVGKNVDVDPIFQFDRDGKLLKSMGRGLFVNVHKMSIDAKGFLWVADNSGNQVFKLDPKTGQVLLTLGTRGLPGRSDYAFDGPTEVVVAANGDFFVADGHNGGGTPTGNARVVKYDRNGRFLLSFGRKGMGPGEFDQVHTLALDSRGRLFVGDRQNNRIQVFTLAGRWLATWYQFGRPSGIFIDRDDTLYVTDSESRDGRTNSGEFALRETGYGYNAGARRGIRIGSARDGRVTAFIPDPCPYPYDSVSTLAEGVAVDAQGAVYAGDFLGDVHRFARKVR